MYCQYILVPHPLIRSSYITHLTTGKQICAGAGLHFEVFINVLARGGVLTTTTQLTVASSRMRQTHTRAATRQKQHKAAQNTEQSARTCMYVYMAYTVYERKKNTRRR